MPIFWCTKYQVNFFTDLKIAPALKFLKLSQVSLWIFMAGHKRQDMSANLIADANYI